MQFLAILNHTYFATYFLVEKGEHYHGKYLQFLEESKKSEAFKKQLESELQALNEETSSMEGELAKAKFKAE